VKDSFSGKISTFWQRTGRRVDILRLNLKKTKKIEWFFVRAGQYANYI